MVRQSVIGAAVAMAASAAAQNACAQVAKAASTMRTPMVSASTAYACLQSVPIPSQPAQDLIESLSAFVEWQSTLAWLKNPPSDYELDAVDLLGELSNIGDKAGSGGYDNEYDFQADIYETLVSAHDGHLSFIPDIFIPLVFTNDLISDLVSVSTDGKELPKLYHRRDLQRNNDTSNMPKSVTQINGQDAAEYFNQNNLKYSIYQDPDAMWNSQFATYQTPTSGPTAAASLMYMGDSIQIEYDDGSSNESESYAYFSSSDAIQAFQNIETGQDYYNAFCLPQQQLSSSSKRSTIDRRSADWWKVKGENSEDNAKDVFRSIQDITKIPKIKAVTPITKGGQGSIKGYFLSGEGYDDTAILSISAFEPDGNQGSQAYLTNFQNTVEDFLQQSQDQGKKKLILDVTGNGGGLVLAGYELFAQIFPNTEQWGANNMRLSDAVSDFGDIVSGISGSFSPSTVEEQQAYNILVTNAVSTNYIPGQVETPAGDDFESIPDILAEVDLNSDKFTAYQNTPLDDPSSGFTMTGTGSRSNPIGPVFDPDNVVILTDGTCGSTCTIVSYLMIDLVGVRTTVAGGRPKTGPMQSIGGVEGSQLFDHISISNTAWAAVTLSSDSSYANGPLGTLSDAYSLRRSASPARAGVNGKNAFGPHDASTPFQFLNQPANCRVFYTYDMITDPQQMWRRVVDATWTDPDTWCVEGSQSEVQDPSTKTDDDFGTGAAPASVDAVSGMRAAVAVVGFSVLLRMMM